MYFLRECLGLTRKIFADDAKEGSLMFVSALDGKNLEFFYELLLFRWREQHGGRGIGNKGHIVWMVETKVQKKV